MAYKKAMKTITHDLSIVYAYFSVILLDMHHKKLSQVEISKLCKIINLSFAMNFKTIAEACQEITLTIAGGYYDNQKIRKLTEELQKFLDEKNSKDKAAPKKCEKVKCRGCESCQNME